MPGLAWAAIMGITPACAGIRLVNMATPSPNRDHPRVRGDKVSPVVVSRK